MGVKLDGENGGIEGVFIESESSWRRFFDRQAAMFGKRELAKKVPGLLDKICVFNLIRYL